MNPEKTGDKSVCLRARQGQPNMNAVNTGRLCFVFVCVHAHAHSCESMHACMCWNITPPDILYSFILFSDELVPYRNQTETNYDVTSRPLTHHNTLPGNFVFKGLANQSELCGCECVHDSSWVCLCIWNQSSRCLGSCTQMPVSFVLLHTHPLPQLMRSFVISWSGERGSWKTLD